MTAIASPVVESARKNRIKQFVIDGEAVVLGVDGIADSNALHSRQHDEEVQLYAFDILALEGEGLLGLPLSMRKQNLAQLLARRPDGIFVAPFEQGEMAPICFAPPAKWDLRAWCRSARIALIAPDGQKTESRSRTVSIRLIGACRISFRSDLSNDPCHAS